MCSFWKHKQKTATLKIDTYIDGWVYIQTASPEGLENSIEATQQEALGMSVGWGMCEHVYIYVHKYTVYIYIYR